MATPLSGVRLQCTATAATAQAPLVHPEEVQREERGLVAAGRRTDLDDDIPAGAGQAASMLWLALARPAVRQCARFVLPLAPPPLPPPPCKGAGDSDRQPQPAIPIGSHSRRAGGQPSPCECRRAPEAAEAVRSAIVFVGVEHRSDQIRPCPRSVVHGGTLSTHADCQYTQRGALGTHEVPIAATAQCRRMRTIAASPYRGRCGCARLPRTHACAAALAGCACAPPAAHRTDTACSLHASCCMRRVVQCHTAGRDDRARGVLGH
jgi:hypothetical protein